MKRPSIGPLTVALTLTFVAVALLSADPVRVDLERRLDPPAVAGQGAVTAQRDAAERALSRGYGKAIEQLKSTGSVRLPVTATHAAAIQQQAVAELRTVRHAALADLAGATGLRAEAATAYINAAEPKLDVTSTDEPGLLLAPGLFAIVSRANLLYAQVADRAIRELTTNPATPAPTPTH